MSAGDSWAIEAELGCTYVEGADEMELRYPWSATVTESGTWLVVDRRMPENVVSEYDREGKVLWSWAAPPRLNVALPLADGRRLLLENTTIRLLSARGLLLSTTVTDLPEAPNAACHTAHGIVVGCDSGLYRLSPDGSVTRIVAPSDGSFLEVQDVWCGADGRYAVTDGTTSTVILLDAFGQRVSVLGQWRRPGRRDGQLMAPQGACTTRDGFVYVADTRRHAVVEIGPRGARRDIAPANTVFRSPAGVRPAGNGTLLVADTGNHRVVLCDTSGRVIRQVGASPYASRLFSFPRSVERQDDGWLVCDSANDRVIIATHLGKVRRAVGRAGEAGDDIGLSLPRSASSLAGGQICIADGLNGRVVIVDRRGVVSREVTHVRSPSRGILRLQDPHQAAEYPGGRLLIVDSDLSAVLVVDAMGNVEREFFGDGSGTAFSDPHQADLVGEMLYVADSGNDRIVMLSMADPHRPAGVIGMPHACPRFVGRFSAWLVVAGTARSTLGWFTEAGQPAFHVGPLFALGPDLPEINPELRLPKWITAASGSRAVVADMLNSRIVLLRRQSPAATDARA